MTELTLGDHVSTAARDEDGEKVNTDLLQSFVVAKIFGGYPGMYGFGISVHIDLYRRQNS